MSTNEAVMSTDSRQTEMSNLSWSKQDTVWMLSLYGTAIGAGTLFLPVAAGLGGIWPLLIVSLLVFPLTYLSHRALTRFVLGGSDKAQNLSDVAGEYFGYQGSRLTTVLYAFSVYPILLMYGVAITNTVQSFILHQLGMNPPHRAITSLVVLMALMFIIRVGHHMVLRSMSLLVYPFVLTLMFFSFYLMPHWNLSVFQSLPHDNHQVSQGILMSIYLLIPTMVFSFNHSPLISVFALNQKKKYGDKAEKKCSQILKNSHLLMIGTVLFFVFSSVLSLSPQQLAEAKAQNLSILSYLANQFNSPVIAWVAPFVAFIAIAKSFFGHYIGASEGIFGLIAISLKKNEYYFCRNRLQLFIDIFIILSCWLVATLNPGILSMIESLNGPVIAVILFLLPMYGCYRVIGLKKYRQFWPDLFLIIFGLLAFSGILFGLLA